MVRKRFPLHCEKIEVRGDGTATLGCRGHDGEPIMHCRDAPDYRDGALPLPENFCLYALETHVPHMNDPFKQPYIETCHNLDETLADPYKAGSTDNLRLRFEGMERNLAEMIASPELSTGDNGRYLYHIDARVLHAFLPAYWHRAEYGLEAEIPSEVIDDILHKVADILSDFSNLYEGVAKQVALRRTEVEILALLLRTRKKDYFPYPTRFREDASETREYNHDAYIVYKGRKIVIQITSSDYKLRNGRKKSEGYDPETIIAIHQHLVNLDYQEGQTIITKFDQPPIIIEHEHDVQDDYEHFAEPPQYVAWGVVPHGEEELELDLTNEYVQEIGGKRRDGLVDALIKEARREWLELSERNALNGASHYLMALISEKQHKIDS